MHDQKACLVEEVGQGRQEPPGCRHVFLRADGQILVRDDAEAEDRVEVAAEPGLFVRAGAAPVPDIAT